MMVLCDIFSVPIHATRLAREKDWSNLVRSLWRLQLTGKCQYTFAELNQLVLQGFLSSQSASYFLTGRASQKQIELLDSFIKFKDSMILLKVPISKILDLWQRKCVVEVENTFLFPLEELAFDLDFISELTEYEG